MISASSCKTVHSWRVPNLEKSLEISSYWEVTKTKKENKLDYLQSICSSEYLFNMNLSSVSLQVCIVDTEDEDTYQEKFLVANQVQIKRKKSEPSRYF